MDSQFTFHTNTPNQAMELTATRRVFTFRMTKTFSLRAAPLSVAVAHLVLVRCNAHAAAVLPIVVGSRFRCPGLGAGGAEDVGRRP